jgi:hypothetical protein
VHVWQFKNERLSFTQKGNLKWFGKYNHAWNKNQLTSPWEIEAVWKEKQLYAEYLKEKN